LSSRQISITDDLDLMLEVMPEHLRSTLEAQDDLDNLLEVVLDLGRLPEARFPERVTELSSESASRQDLEHIVEHLGSFGNDNRAGIERTLHRISAIRNRVGDVIGLTCRVGRAVFGTVDIVRDVIEAGSSILLLGRPGVGKTTLLREAARVLGDELDKRVVVVDTSNEIAGDGDIPHPGIGRARRMQVPSPERQHAVMIEAVENHMPEVIVIDEIGTEAEALAARTIAERGVQLIATAHGNTLDNLLQNPTLCDLIGGIQAVTLSDEEARRRGTQKTVLERKAPPTFDVIIEIQDKDRLAVHHDVSMVVDRFLRGIPPRAEIRIRTADGEVQIQEPKTAETQPGSFQGAPGTVTGVLRRRRIFPYAVSRSKLQRAIEDLQVPASIVNQLDEGDVFLTLKSQERRQPRRLRDAELKGLPIYAVRSNTVKQMENFLQALFNLADEQAEALREVETAVNEALDQAHPVELLPQNSYVRRLQHQLVEHHGLTSDSRGEEPYRRVVVYPA
jgi:stage III sporulation protein SpoIIIAA